MMRLRLCLICVALSVGMGGCGFTPVYSNGAASSNVHISTIEGRTGYVLRRALQEKALGAMGGLQAGGVLDITLEEDVSRLTFRPDGFTARAALNLNATYTLTFGDKTLTGTSSALSYFNIPDAEYGDIAVQLDARQAAAQLLADQITTDIASKLTQP